MKVLQHKGIAGVVKEKRVEGKISGYLLVDGGFAFYGDTIEEMIEDFKGAVEAYFEACEAMDIEPEIVERLDGKEDSIKLMKYKDYIGSIEYSEEDKMFFGEIQGIDSIVGYGGETISELEETFRESVDEFVEGYKNNNLEPPISFKELDIAKE